MILVSSPVDCCGCEACKNACPKLAITMKEDNKGFLYPSIDENKCNNCGLCKNICDFQVKDLSNSSLPSVYAVINKNEDQLLLSSSGGAFSAMAKWILDKNGVVFGCAWNDNMEPQHIAITDLSKLNRLQGSKYVQSRIGYSYQKVRNYLNEGKYVLFSGTPCQCAGLRTYLRKEYDKLICVELICHGVPSRKFFLDYINLLEKKLNGKILDIRFRDKKRGWGALLYIKYKDKYGRQKHKYLSVDESYYYNYYWSGNFYRESCYSCKYACLYRRSDFTIGDYWGIRSAHPEIDISKGVSIILVNTPKGEKNLQELSHYMFMTPSNIEFAIKENGQLISASTKKEQVDVLWDIYLNGGAEAIQNYYIHNNRKRIIMGKIKRIVPLSIKNFARKVLIR